MTRFEQQEDHCICFICKHSRGRVCGCDRVIYKTGRDLGRPQIQCPRTTNKAIVCISIRQCTGFEIMHND